jgi:RecB family exonuclease
VPQKTYSATELESYQKCPYHYYHKYILKEPELETLTDDIAATKWGTLVHKILYHYYQGPLTKENLFTIAQNLFKEYAEDTFYWRVKEEILHGLLDTFYTTELDHPLTLRPTSFEHPFVFTLPHSDLTLKGTIDLILESPNGGCIAVLDYKTRKTIPTSADFKEFRTLQLPIYQLILTHQHPEKECIAGIFYQLIDHENVTKTIVAITETGKTHLDIGRKRPYKIEDDYYRRLTHHLIQLKESIEGGHMSPTHSPLCKVCGYRSTCYEANRFTH